MITLEWVKTIAENLRLGLYKPEILYFGGGRVCLTDVNRNVVLEIQVSIKSGVNIQTEGKTTRQVYDSHVDVCVTIRPKNSNRIDDYKWTTYTVDSADDNFLFWKDFNNWIRQHNIDNKLQLELKVMEAFTL